MENVKKKKQNKSFPRWLTLSLYSNCFGEGDMKHLGLKFRGIFFCITHSAGNGILIDKKYLKMARMSTEPEYFKVCLQQPIKLHSTQMKINESFIVNAILSLELNKK